MTVKAAWYLCHNSRSHASGESYNLSQIPLLRIISSNSEISLGNMTSFLNNFRNRSQPSIGLTAIPQLGIPTRTKFPRIHPTDVGQMNRGILAGNPKYPGCESASAGPKFHVVPCLQYLTVQMYVTTWPFSQCLRSYLVALAFGSQPRTLVRGRC